MAEKQVLKRDATLAHFTTQSQKRFVVADSEEKRDKNSFPKSAIDNNHPLPNQPIPPPTISSKILSPLTKISGINILLPPRTYHDLKEEKDFLELSNTLQGKNITD